MQRVDDSTVIVWHALLGSPTNNTVLVPTNQTRSSPEEGAWATRGRMIFPSVSESAVVKGGGEVAGGTTANTFSWLDEAVVPRTTIEVRVAAVQRYGLSTMAIVFGVSQILLCIFMCRPWLRLSWRWSSLLRPFLSCALHRHSASLRRRAQHLVLSSMNEPH